MLLFNNKFINTCQPEYLHCYYNIKIYYYIFINSHIIIIIIIIISIIIIIIILIFAGSFEEDTTMPKGLESWNKEKETVESIKPPESVSTTASEQSDSRKA